MSTEVFVRKTTGLAKPFGFWDPFILAMGLLNLGIKLEKRIADLERRLRKAKRPT